MISPEKNNPERKWFGNKEVTPEEKTDLVRGVFDSVAENYDLMNDLMSFGVHRLWKDRFVSMIRPRPYLHYLDIAGGTGDIAFRIRKKTGAGARITVCDLDLKMVEVGRNRSEDRGLMNDIEWLTGNAEALPLADKSIDVCTIAFGLRNVTHIDTALSEISRVLKPGGRFYCLEFSTVDEPFLAQMYDRYSHSVIPQMGEIIAKDRESYQYLVESIRKFPEQKELARRLSLAGFKNVKYTNLSFGVACIHQGTVA